ncbi:hypothetical protein [Stakelama marina]|uniref:Glycerophosphoryl diester phosphodiesterase membrane domain-containing protein n=1 Tax=Stakelama marina TaxID=2826939 RepID=A0A8T4IB16_9SPHN|nr:hypothetical protein [Stakelama marina]MBR0551014.1 hypothetical protein [Stakelama marina]
MLRGARHRLPPKAIRRRAGMLVAGADPIGANRIFARNAFPPRFSRKGEIDMDREMLAGLMGLSLLGVFVIGVVVTVVMAIREARRHEWEFGIGNVIGRTGELLARLPLVLGGIGLLAGILFTGAFAAIVGHFRGTVSILENSSLWGAFLVYWLIAFTIGVFFRTIGLRAAIDAAFGSERASLADLLRDAARLFPRIFGVSALLVIATWFGYALLIVPGIIVTCAWFCVAAIVVAEDCSVTEAFSRGSELTRGARWRILLLYIIGILALGIVQVILGFLAGMIGGDLKPYVAMAFSTAVGVAIVPAFLAASYHELRTNKEGGGVEELEAVFA